MSESRTDALARMAAAQDPKINDPKVMGPAFKDAGNTIADAKPEARKPVQSDEGLLPYVASAASYLVLLIAVSIALLAVAPTCQGQAALKIGGVFLAGCQ